MELKTLCLDVDVDVVCLAVELLPAAWKSHYPRVELEGALQHVAVGQANSITLNQIVCIIFTN